MSRLTATERMRRLLAVIPWASGQGDVTLDEIAERFDYPSSLLRRDLIEVVQYVGVYPHTPDMLIEVDLDDESGRVRFELADYFRQPLQLSPPEALSLLSAGLGLLESSTGPNPSLETGLAKVADRFGVTLGDDLDVSLGNADVRVVGMVRDAVAANEVLEIEYHSPNHGASTRAVEPLRVFSSDGEWYLSAYCRHAQGERTFRLDRVLEVVGLGETFEPRTEGAEVSFAARQDDIRVRLELAAEAAWVAEVFPVEEVEPGDDGIVVTLAVSSERWLEVLLLQLGHGARLVGSTPELPAGFRSAAAAKVLARYRD